MAWIKERVLYTQLKKKLMLHVKENSPWPTKYIIITDFPRLVLKETVLANKT